MALRCVPFPNSISWAVSGGTLLSVLTLVKFELVAMMVLALFFAATNLERGLPRLSMARCVGLPMSGSALASALRRLSCRMYVASVGVEMVSGTLGAGVCACVVTTEAEVAISGILMVSQWGAAMVMVSVGHLRGDDSCSQDCSIAALNLLVVVACVHRFQPFVMCFQPFVLLPCAWTVSFRDAKEHASKVWGKIAKVKRTHLFPGQKD